MTGSYHNYFRIFDVESQNDIVLQADKSAFKAKKMAGQVGNKAGAQKNGLRPSNGLKEQMAADPDDFNKKILHGSWHPRENTIAVRVSCDLCQRTGFLICSIYLSILFCVRRLRRPTISFCTVQHEKKIQK